MDFIIIESTEDSKNIEKLKTKLNKTELLTICKELGITGCSSKKIDVIKEIIQKKLTEKKEPKEIKDPKEPNSLITLYRGNAFDELDKVEDKSIQTICIES